MMPAITAMKRPAIAANHGGMLESRNRRRPRLEASRSSLLRSARGGFLENSSIENTRSIRRVRSATVFSLASRRPTNSWPPSSSQSQAAQRKALPVWARAFSKSGSLSWIISSISLFRRHRLSAVRWSSRITKSRGRRTVITVAPPSELPPSLKPIGSLTSVTSMPLV